MPPFRHRAGDHAIAERMWKEAVIEAHTIGARSFELRAAVILPRTISITRRFSESIGLLEPIYRGFHEGFDTQDLRNASQLLRYGTRCWLAMTPHQCEARLPPIFRRSSASWRRRAQAIVDPR